MVLEQLDIHRPKKMSLTLHLTLYTKINPQWIMDLSGKHKTIKPLGKTREKSLKSRTRERVLRLDTQSTAHERLPNRINPNKSTPR